MTYTVTKHGPHKVRYTDHKFAYYKYEAWGVTGVIGRFTNSRKEKQKIFFSGIWTRYISTLHGMIPPI